MIPVIICGGIGSKMWPESRQKCPKHFLPLLNGKSLFQINYETLRGKFKPAEIFISTTEQQVALAKEVATEVPESNYIVEPELRNHGPATGLIAASLYKNHPDEPFMLVQVDVLREPAEKFLGMMTEVGKLALSTDKYITAGFCPTTIVRGVDYLVKGKTVSEEGGVKIYEVADYIGRTEEEKIKQYLGTDKLLLHANHTAMTPNNLLKMYKKYKPEWYGPLMVIAQGGVVTDEYAKMPKGAIEEATIPAYKAGEALVVELPFNWVDFGTWESVSRYLIEKGVYQPQDVHEVEAKNNFVKKPAGKYVAMIGVEDLVVIDTGDALLITKKDQSGKVGQVVDKLKEEGRMELL